jgi:hypothetical protein
VPSKPTHAPKHRAAKPRRVRPAALKTSLTLSSMAVLATGVAVGSGSLSLSAIGGPSATHDITSTNAASGPLATTPAAATTSRDRATTTAPSSDASARTQADARTDAAAAASTRSQTVTRSDSRASTDPLKAGELSLGQGNTLARSESLDGQAPQVIAQALLSKFGWSQDQFGCLDSLWTRESNWNIHANNPFSSAYGIPQALPGSKMASAGSDWENNAVTQITWGLGYIRDRYGSPCGAWAHSQSSGFY